MLVVDRVGDREIGPFPCEPLLLGVQADRVALRQRDGRGNRQLRARAAEVVAVVATQDQGVQRVPDPEGARGGIDGREAVVAGETQSRGAGLADDAALDIERTVRRSDAPRAVQADAAEVELTPRPQ